jgi:hypothetical protein
MQHAPEYDAVPPTFPLALTAGSGALVEGIMCTAAEFEIGGSRLFKKHSSTLILESS